MGTNKFVKLSAQKRNIITTKKLEVKISKIIGTYNKVT
jgi:hypothetical protein